VMIPATVVDDGCCMPLTPACSLVRNAYAVEHAAARWPRPHGTDRADRLKPASRARS